MDIINLSKHKVKPSSSRDYYAKTPLETLNSQNTSGFVSICGRPSTGKTTILIDVMIERTRIKSERALFLYFDINSLFKLSRRIESLSNLTGTILTLEEPIQSIEEIKNVMESHTVNIDSVYIDDMDILDLNYLNDEIELEVESPYASLISQSTRDILGYLKAKSHQLNVFCVNHVSRRPDIRGGDHKPRISDVENPLIEKVASKILMLYRPENYRIPCDEEGNQVTDIVHVSFVKNNEGEINKEHRYEITGYGK